MNQIHPNAAIARQQFQFFLDSEHESTETQELNAVSPVKSPPVSHMFDSEPDTCRLRHELQKLQEKYDETLDELVDTKYKLQRRTYNQRELLKQRDEWERELDEQDTEIADMKKDYELNIFFLEHWLKDLKGRPCLPIKRGQYSSY